MKGYLIFTVEAGQAEATPLYHAIDAIIPVRTQTKTDDSPQNNSRDTGPFFCSLPFPRLFFRSPSIQKTCVRLSPTLA